ncbi:proteasome regulatory particle base subunit RPN10 KNAG_0M00250 [Huiozyma naganishii CBS 8797]|uniref:VWFA domain-containing protein n=1 Tax=Huiozyma naganishii (strain ATCC MYA-139 / BCRC 22969 / CBS 8797 / KCTC 17520 / NBRC 10181 / NCYC 3082 / Yp74L-3) TaxID=1071383 RepID=J7RSI2_HUIN7|nr:hypothetical protein KNAG_0M00250 [Kazachstania naganishii CBS 8797]CCK72878.1 hypothetical protein KNAG_0M00250 [Kazachstania naganishii CBS 8797]
MVLEATVLVVDNSEYARNGDFPQNRFEAQIDAVEYVFQAKRNANLENSVALVSAAAAGGTPRVLSTFTSEFGKILSGLHDTVIEGQAEFATALEIAALTLKHRQNGLQRQRICLFVCSPIREEERDRLLTLARRFRKNMVALDVVNFGEMQQNADLLAEVVAAVNAEGETYGSHLVNVERGPRLLYETVATSPIIMDEASAAAAAAAAQNGDGDGGDGNFMDFGVDASMDPELAMALRLSMEEEQQRQERLRQDES